MSSLATGEHGPPLRGNAGAQTTPADKENIPATGSFNRTGRNHRQSGGDPAGGRAKSPPGRRGTTAPGNASAESTGAGPSIRCRRFPPCRKISVQKTSVDDYPVHIVDKSVNNLPFQGFGSG